jgi:hypothetical protein
MYPVAVGACPIGTSMRTRHTSGICVRPGLASREMVSEIQLELACCYPAVLGTTGWRVIRACSGWVPTRGAVDCASAPLGAVIR